MLCNHLCKRHDSYGPLDHDTTIKVSNTTTRLTPKLQEWCVCYCPVPSGWGYRTPTCLFVFWTRHQTTLRIVRVVLSNHRNRFLPARQLSHDHNWCQLFMLKHLRWRASRHTSAIKPYNQAMCSTSSAVMKSIVPYNVRFHTIPLGTVNGISSVWHCRRTSTRREWCLITCIS